MLALSHVYEGRWGCHDNPQQTKLEEFLSKRAGDSLDQVQISSSDFEAAASKIKNLRTMYHTSNM